MATPFQQKPQNIINLYDFITSNSETPNRELNYVINQYSILKSRGEHPELEIRYSFYLDKLNDTFLKSGIPPLRFFQLREKFNQMNIAFTEINSRDTNYPEGSQRVTNGSTEWINKQSIRRYTDQNLGLILSLSNEKPIPPPTMLPSTPSNIREKQRFQYPFYEYNALCDMTIVHETNLLKGTKSTNYELELEFISSTTNYQSDIIKFLDGVGQIYLWLYDTECFYNRSLIIELKSKIYTTLGLDPSQPLMNRARDLKMKDLVFGGLVGNQQTSYHVTYKTDGIRKYLFANNIGLWLIMPDTNEYNLLYPYMFTNVYMFDGEYVPQDRFTSLTTDEVRSKSYWFLIFDALIAENQNLININDHNKRLKTAREFLRGYGGSDPEFLNDITIEIKTFMSLLDPIKLERGIFDIDDFYKNMRDLLLRRNLLPYKDDGLIFTPVNSPYYPNMSPNKGNFTLVEEPDIVKWKPLEQLTIDFKIHYLSRDTIQLLTSRNEPFKGSQKYPFSGTISAKDISEPEGSIIEFGWTGDTFIPYRTRRDKLYPNSTNTAQKVWELINRPVTEDVLCGNSLDQVYDYHNSIKMELYNQSGGYLVDIGSGRGGDLAKWRNFTKVIAVEPNLENLKELQKRLANSNIKNKVKVIQAGGEDTDLIEKTMKEFFGQHQKADVVSFMLSLSFFWDSQKHVEQIIETCNRVLKPDGKIIYLTIDGDSVQQLFRPIFSHVRVENPLLLTHFEHPERVIASLTYEDKPIDTLYVDLPNTIVGKQQEYLVRLMDFTSLSNGEYVMTMTQRATKQQFLPPMGKLFTSLYTYGIINRITPIQVQLPIISQDYPRLPALPKMYTPKVKEEGIVSTPLGALPFTDEAPSSQWEQLAVAKIVRYASPIESSLYYSIINAVYNNGELKDVKFVEQFREGIMKWLSKIQIDGEEWKQVILNIERDRLGQIEYQVLGDLLNVQIVVYNVKTNGIFKQFETITNTLKPIILLNQINDHIELLGQIQNNAVVTVFQQIPIF